MTDDLTKAIAELRRDGPEDATWTASLVADGNPYQSSLAGAVAAALFDLLTGDLIPKADADLAVALMVEVTAERSSLSAMFATQAEETQAAKARVAELEAIIRGKTFTVDEAAELKAEVERLRKALDGQTRNCPQCKGTGKSVDAFTWLMSDKKHEPEPTDCRWCRAGRAALQETKP